MTASAPKRVAILATGSEIVNGDIANSNGQALAQQLTTGAISVGMQVSCGDILHDLESSLSFLWQRHCAVITIGGLGPTSDDRTRNAVANVLGLPLYFDEPAWARINALFAQKGVTLTDNNRQQAYFPQNCRVIVNPYGSASGCAIFHHQRWLFMLPGPPRECIPLFEQYVIPQLINDHFANKLYRKRWTVKNISESLIASRIDGLTQEFEQISIAYCCRPPTIDITLETVNGTLFAHLVPQIAQEVAQLVMMSSKRR